MNDPPKDDPSRPLVTRPVGSAAGKRGELHGYDGPLAYATDDPDSTAPPGPTVITVKGVPPQMIARCHFLASLPYCFFSPIERNY
jgi:hypothetical protein